MYLASVIVGVCLLVLTSNAAKLTQVQRDRYEAKFREFIKTYNKVYLSDNEYERRFGIFVENLKKAEGKMKNQPGNATNGVTKFSDLTEDEVIRLQGLHWRKKYTSTEKITVGKVHDRLKKHYDQKFKDFTKKNKKVYNTTAEYKKRFGIIMNNTKKAEEKQKNARGMEAELSKGGFSAKRFPSNQNKDVQKQITVTKNENQGKPYEQEFKEFIKIYNKVYRTDAERERKFAIFVENMKMAEQRQELTGATYGVNKFFDLTADEFIRYLGFVSKPNRNITLKEMAERRDEKSPINIDFKDENAKREPHTKDLEDLDRREKKTEVFETSTQESIKKTTLNR